MYRLINANKEIGDDVNKNKKEIFFCLLFSSLFIRRTITIVDTAKEIKKEYNSHIILVSYSNVVEYKKTAQILKLNTNNI